MYLLCLVYVQIHDMFSSIHISIPLTSLLKKYGHMKVQVWKKSEHMKAHD
jgi:hypothetical protein